MIILEPLKKFARDFNSEISVWALLPQEFGVSIISITSNFAFFTFIKQTN